MWGIKEQKSPRSRDFSMPENLFLFTFSLSKKKVDLPTRQKACFFHMPERRVFYDWCAFP
jgi:hypothetical protein